MSMPKKKVGVASLFPKRACNHLVLPWWNIVLDRCYDFELKSGSARGRKIVVAKVDPILDIFFIYTGSLAGILKRREFFVERDRSYLVLIWSRKLWYRSVSPHPWRSDRRFGVHKFVNNIPEYFGLYFRMSLRFLCRFQNHPT